MEGSYSDPIWEKALELISQQVNEGTFHIWFGQTAGLGLTDGMYSVGVSSDFAKDWIDSRFRTLISDAVSQAVGSPVDCEIVVVPNLDHGPSQGGQPGRAGTATPAPRGRRCRDRERAQAPAGDPQADSGTGRAPARAGGHPGGDTRRRREARLRRRPRRQVHVRHLRRRPVEPIRPRGRSCRGGDTRAPSTTPSSSMAAWAWARRIFSKPWGTTSYGTIQGSRSGT